LIENLIWKRIRIVDLPGNDRVKWSLMLLAAILFLGILSMWVPARWAVTAFQIAVFALAAVHIVTRVRKEKPITIHPGVMLLGAGVLWGVIQAAAGWTVDRFKTLSEVLNWITNLSVFALGFELSRDRGRRQQFLSALLWFGTALAAVSMLTVFSSPDGMVFWLFNAGSDRRTLGPFVYYNQYASFIEAVLPLATTALSRLRFSLTRQGRPFQNAPWPRSA
jgi:hypothetical protein